LIELHSVSRQKPGLGAGYQIWGGRSAGMPAILQPKQPVALHIRGLQWVMYGRRPRCKGKSDVSAKRSGAVMYPACFRLEDCLLRDAAAMAAGPDVIR